MEKKKIRVSTLISTILFSLVLLLFVLTCILQLSLPEANGSVSWSKGPFWAYRQIHSIQLRMHKPYFMFFWVEAGRTAWLGSRLDVQVTHTPYRVGTPQPA